MSGERFIGIDIGGTFTRVTKSTSLEHPTLQSKTIFPTTNNFDEDYLRVRSSIDKYAPVTGIGISLPGELDENKLQVIHANNVQGYINKPLPTLLSEAFNCETRMDNDAAAAALGEALYGTPNKTPFTYIIWGTGIGGAQIDYTDGHPVSSKLDWSTYLQSWENGCAGKNLQQRFGVPAENLTEHQWSEVMTRFSEELLEFSAKLPTRRIIFGGGITHKQSYRLRQMATQVQKKHTQKLPSIETSTLGEDAGLYGALGLLKSH